MDTYQVSDLRKNPAPIMARVRDDRVVAQITRHNDVVLFMVPIEGYVAWARASRGQPDAVAATVGDIAAELGFTAAAVSAIVTHLCNHPEWGRGRVVLVEDREAPSMTWIHRDAAVEIARLLAADPEAGDAG